jgi:aryl-alcohol dehydrogenase (NADP+)
MKKNRLGASALEVSEFCLGTMTWGEQNTESQGHAQIDWALERGINFIDTAEMYPIPPAQKTQGATEKILGTWLAKNKAKRAGLVIASKIAGPGRREWIRNGENRVTKKTIPWAIDDSLNRLQTDTIDLYQIHWPERYVPAFGAWQYDPSKEREETPIVEQIEAMAVAIKAGKIRAYGLSNETAWGLCEFTRVAKEHGLPPPASVQNGYSPAAEISGFRRALQAGARVRRRRGVLPDRGKTSPAARRHRARVREAPLFHRLDDHRRDLDHATGRACGVF